MEPGLEHPGKQRTRTGTSGGRKPWIGTSRATQGGGNGGGEKRRGDIEQEQGTVEGGYEEQESGRGRRRRRRRSRQKHGTQTGTSGEATHQDWNIQVVEAPDWNVRGRSNPALERPGLHKEETAAAARNSKENMNESQERWREGTRRTRVRMREEKEKKEKRPWIGASRAGSGGRSSGDRKRQGEHEQEQGTVEKEGPKKESREAGGEGWEGKADKRMEHPGEAGLHKGDWNNRGAEALDWKVGGRSGPELERPGLQKEEEMATERSGEEKMNKSKEQMRRDVKNKSREAGGEGGEGEAAEHMEPG